MGTTKTGLSSSGWHETWHSIHQHVGGHCRDDTQKLFHGFDHWPSSLHLARTGSTASCARASCLDSDLGCMGCLIPAGTEHPGPSVQADPARLQRPELSLGAYGRRGGSRMQMCGCRLVGLASSE